MKKYFLTYDDGTRHFSTVRKKLEASVKLYAPEFEIITFSRKEIPLDFILANKDIFDIRVGGGVWLWKPYIIQKTLERLNDGDILFYMDARYYFLEPFEDLYSTLFDKKDFLIWANKPNDPTHPFWRFCRKDVMLRHGVYDELYQNDNVLGCWAGAMVMRKTKFTTALMSDWLDMCQIKEDIWGPGGYAEHVDEIFPKPGKECHRHDQSLLGILIYKRKIVPEFLDKKYLENLRNPWKNIPLWKK